MKMNTNGRVLANLAGFVKFAGVAPVVGGFAVLAGWVLNIPVLQSIIPGYTTMKPLTALVFIVAGVAFVFLRREAPRPGERLVGLGFAMVVVAIGGIVLLEYLLNVNVGIDLWLFREGVMREEVAHPGRPAPAAAFCFFSLGLALLNLHRKPGWLMDLLAVPVSIVCLLALVGYAFDVSSLYQIEPFSPIALHTAVLLLILAVGLLCAFPQRTVLGILTTDLAGGISARRLMPAAVLIPLLLGWLELQGELAGLYAARFGAAMFVTLTIVVLSGLVLVHARSLDQSDLHRTTVLDTLRDMERKYRTIVEQTPAIVYMDEIGGNWRYISPQVGRILGFTSDDLLADASLWKRRVHQADVERLNRQIADCETTGKPLASEFRFFAGDGRLIWLRDEAVVVRDPATDRAFLQGVMYDISERKQAEEQVRYQADLLEQVNDAIVASDENYILKAWNPAAEKLYGWRAEEVLGRRRVDLLQTEFSGTAADEMQRQIAEKGSYVGEAVQVRKDGTRVQVEVASMALRDEAGHLTGYVSVNRDITERKQAEENLRAMEAKYRAMVENVPAIIYLSAPDQYIGVSYIGPQIKTLGFSQEEWIADPNLWVGQIHPADRDRVLAEVQQSAATASPFNVEYRLLTRAGTIKWVHDYGRHIVDEAGKLLYIQGFMQDITESREAAEKLRASEARYHNVLDTMFEGCQIISPDWRYLYVNEAAAGQGRHPRTELLGCTMQEKYPNIENTKLFEILRACMETRSSRRMENEFLFSDGSSRWFELSIRPVPEGLFILSFDITARKQAEKEREARLVLEAKNAELDRFAYTVSHDLKSPLFTVKGFLSHLRKDIANGNLDRAASDLKFVENAVEKMQELLTGVLALSRAGAALKQPEGIPFGELAYETIELLHGALEAGAAAVTIQPNLPTVLGDRMRLRQVLQNLVENAVKYRNPHQPLAIEIGARGNDETGKPILFVQDNGMGIPPEFHERIFDLFDKVDSQSDGGGVGLATVKRIIEVHGGRVWVESEAGGGSTFLFTLPSQPQPDSVL